MLLDSNVCDAMRSARAAENSDSFTRAATVLSETRSAVREALQEQTSESVQGIISKLSAGEPLSPEDLPVLRLWIIGDAESFIRMENNYKDWVSEFTRLESTINGYLRGQPSQEDLTALYGLLQDAMRVAADISDYLEKKERVARFEQASREIGPSEARLLLDILKAELNSPAM